MHRLYEPLAYSPDVRSYWETTSPPIIWPELLGNKSTDVVIIGAGYTGLNAALELARSFGNSNVIVLEANQPGWGASGRNGGFCCMGGAKLSTKAQISRFGETATAAFLQEQVKAIASVKDNLAHFSIDANTHSEGETQLAHRASAVDDMHLEAELLERLIGVKSTFLPKLELAQAGLASPEFHGAMTNPHGFALNPMLYVLGLAKQISNYGILKFGNSPAIDIQQRGNGFTVKTPKGEISARRLILATNAYSSEDLPPWMAGRILPTMTNIIATRPLTDAELAMQGWTSYQMSYDTRNAVHYFHLTPPAHANEGPRMVFGMRGGVSATKASFAERKAATIADFQRIFPAWKDVEVPYFWSGLVCLSRDLTCHIGQLGDWKNAWTALAYHGNGVAMASHSGKLIARLMSDAISLDGLPTAMRAPLRRFPLPRLRRTFLRAAFRWSEYKDNLS